MKTILLIAATTVLMSCNKECNDHIDLAGCSEEVPVLTGNTNTCLAYFESWFFNSETNSCELAGYSGCSAVGFATEKECEECKCHD